MNVRLLSKILPGWEFEDSLEHGLMFRHVPPVWESIKVPRSLAYLEHLVERALLTPKSETVSGPIAGMEWTLWAPCGYRDDEPIKLTLLRGGGEDDLRSGRSPNKLSALLEAAAPLYQGGEE